MTLLDGSGTQVETYLDRGEGQRSRLEKKLDQLKKRKDQVREELAEDVSTSWEGLYGEATKALSNNDTNAAQKFTSEMEKLLQGGAPTWKRKARGLSNYTEVVLQYSFLLDPPIVQQLKTLLDQMGKAIQNDDQTEVENLYLQLDKATDDLPRPVLAVMAVRRAIVAAENKNMEVEADQLAVVLRNMESAMRDGDHDKAGNLFEVIIPVIYKLFASSKAPSSKDSIEDLAKK